MLIGQNRGISTLKNEWRLFQRQRARRAERDMTQATLCVIILMMLIV